LPFAPYRRMAMQAQWAGGRVSRAYKWAELQASWLRQRSEWVEINAPPDIIQVIVEAETINGNGKLMETENVTFYVS